VEAAYVRAHDLCHLLGETPALVGVLYGLATLHEYRGDFHLSQALIEERLQLLGSSGDPSLLAVPPGRLHGVAGAHLDSPEPVRP
jgi:hypothetical protein